MICQFLITLFLYASSLHAEELQVLPFSTLSHVDRQVFNNKEVRIRGFLYKSPDGFWILAEHPNLKSCCIGKPHMRDSQIILDANLDDSRFIENAIIEVKGFLSLDAVDGYHLKNSNVQERERGKMPFMTIGVMTLLGLLLWVFRPKSKKVIP